MGAIEVRRLLVEPGGQTVLHGLDLTVPAGQITGLLGPILSGKSTLMRAIVGGQVVAGGDVRVLGEPAGSVQFMPAFVLPQLLLCGLFVPRDQMAPVLEAASYALPLTYAFDALDRLAEDGSLGGRGWFDVAMVVGMTILALVLGAPTLPRRTP